ncbi:MAG TPA: FliM/FliN family flagellar motor switch protein, partial [Sphingorhabdus sp.]|nr:FliM/FliN family flagellar motor switch protein [Sphingorhabdus sp.]
MSDLSEAPKIERAPNRTSPVNLLAGISVRVSVEVGSTMMTIAELATLEAGNVVALDRKVGEPLDICANG